MGIYSSGFHLEESVQHIEHDEHAKAILEELAVYEHAEDVRDDMLNAVQSIHRIVEDVHDESGDEV